MRRLAFVPQGTGIDESRIRAIGSYNSLQITLGLMHSPSTTACLQNFCCS